MWCRRLGVPGAAPPAPEKFEKFYIKINEKFLILSKTYLIFDKFNEKSAIFKNTIF